MLEVLRVFIGSESCKYSCSLNTPQNDISPEAPAIGALRKHDHLQDSGPGHPGKEDRHFYPGQTVTFSSIVHLGTVTGRQKSACKNNDSPCMEYDEDEK